MGKGNLKIPVFQVYKRALPIGIEWNEMRKKGCNLQEFNEVGWKQTYEGCSNQELVFKYWIKWELLYQKISGQEDLLEPCGPRLTNRFHFSLIQLIGSGFLECCVENSEALPIFNRKEDCDRWVMSAMGAGLTSVILLCKALSCLSTFIHTAVCLEGSLTHHYFFHLALP